MPNEVELISIFIGHLDNQFSEVPVRVFYSFTCGVVSFSHRSVDLLSICDVRVLCQAHVLKSTCSHFYSLKVYYDK